MCKLFVNMSQELLEQYYAAERAINQYQKGIQHQLGIMCGVMHTLDGRKQRSRPSSAAADSSYAAHEFLQPEPHSDYDGDDIASHGTADVPDTPIWHPSDIGNSMGDIHYCMNLYIITHIILLCITN